MSYRDDAYQDYDSWLGDQGYRKDSPYYTQFADSDRLKDKWREEAGFEGDAWDMKHRGHQGGGYLPGSRMEMQKMLDFLQGKSANTEGINAMNLSTENGQESRFLSRMGYMDYMNDPNVTRGREFFSQMLEGGMVEGKMKSANRDALDRSSAANRASVKGSAGTSDVRMPGAEAYLTRKQESAFAGQMGQVGQQAAMADINARAMASGELQREKMIQQNLITRMMTASTDSVQWNQKIPEAPNPWKSMGMNLLGTVAGAAFGPVGAGIGGAIAQGFSGGGGGEGGYYPSNPGAGGRGSGRTPIVY